MRLLLPMSTYRVEVDKITIVLGSTEQWAVVSSERLPSSMKVIRHHIDKFQFPGDGGKEMLIDFLLMEEPK